MNKFGIAMTMAAGTLLVAAPAFPLATTDQGQGQAVVTVLSKKNMEVPANILAQDLQVKVNGKQSSVTNWVRLSGANDGLELVVLIDGSAQSSLGQQLGEIGDFIKGLPPNVKVGVGYMENGMAAMAGPLSTDHAKVAGELHVPAGIPGSNASPYFCLSNLAQHWPSQDHTSRHEVVMITDGVDNYYNHFDLDDPYVSAAVKDSVKAGLVVYSIYWRDRGRFDDASYMSYDGESLLSEVTAATGGASYWIGTGNPVTLKPYFDNIDLRLRNQYRLSFNSGLQGKPQVEAMALKVGGPAAKVYAPQQVFVVHPAAD